MPIGIVLLLAAVELPATFSGDLPCADCEALRYHLDLLEEGVYFRRLLYVGKSSRGFDVILAGGLTPENVSEALASLGDLLPWGVDVASGVEGPDRRKQRERIAAFVRAVREETGK